jgi:hypothetical protein
VESKSDEGSGSEVESKSHDTHKNHATPHKECRSRSVIVDPKQKRRELSKRAGSRLRNDCRDEIQKVRSNADSRLVRKSIDGNSPLESIK